MSGDPAIFGGNGPWPYQFNVCGGGIPQPFVFAPIPPSSLSDADIERIARRVVDLLREAKP